MKLAGMQPLALQNRPVLTRRQALDMKDFERLSKDRRRGAGGKPLPLTTSELWTYARIHGVRDSDSFMEKMESIDEIYLDALAEKEEKSPKGPSKPSQSSPAPIPRRAAKR